MNRNKNKTNLGFTLIELLVVIAIIALLTSIALIAFMSARQKARDANRLANMTEMNNALELYFATNKGYPSGTLGVPQGLTPSVLASLPKAPTPPDGVCVGLAHSAACSSLDPSCSGVAANTYYYAASGTAYQGFTGGPMVYPDYSYFLCLGNQTGNFSSGERILNPKGLK